MKRASPGSRRIAVFGSTSEIAFAVARRLALTDARLVLLGRDMEALQNVARDLTVRGASEVQVRLADFARSDEAVASVATAWEALGALDAALLAFGDLPDQTAAENDYQLAEETLCLNFQNPLLICNALAKKFEAQGSGTIAVITSVAGERGRKGNLIYGAAKGGLQRYLEGLRHRLFASGIRVLDIRPGRVATKMTEHMEQSGPLWARPDQVADDIVAALASNKTMLYTPWYWRLIMLALRNLPAPLWHRMSF